jgi:subtilisin family serine protease
MRYYDKSAKRAVDLTESRTKFLVMTKPGDQEVLISLMSQGVFAVTPSTNQDGVFILQAKSGSEPQMQLRKAVDGLRADSRVLTVQPAFEDREGISRYVLSGRVTVKFRDLGNAAVERYLRSINSSVLTGYSSPGLYDVAVPTNSEFGAFIDALNANERVEFAEPTFYSVSDADTRIRFGGGNGMGSEGESVGGNLLWNMARLGLGEAWTVTRGRADIVIGVVDGMPELDHEALRDRFIVTMNDEFIFSQDRSPASHATNCCSIAAGQSATLSGVAPGVSLLPLVINLNSQTYAERAGAFSKAADLAIKRRVGTRNFSRLVLSCSWRTSGDIAVIRTAIEEAINAGVLVVFSAGNDGTNASHYPSDYSHYQGALGAGTLSVAATDQDDRKAPYSNFSLNVNVCAPGGNGLPFDERDIYCADLGNSYAYEAGTSMAAPHVAGLAALLLSLDDTLSVRDLKRLITANAVDITTLNPAYEHELGSGRADAYRAVSAVKRPDQPVGQSGGSTSPNGQTGSNSSPGDQSGGNSSPGGQVSSPGPHITIADLGPGPRIRFGRADAIIPARPPVGTPGSPIRLTHRERAR